MRNFMSRVTYYDVVDIYEIQKVMMLDEKCKHDKEKTYQPKEWDTNVSESYSCDECGEELDLPEPEEDTIRGEDR
tara:strand:- start:207 stop:431 length:225 start_codon:yes stop_codon:yes gene_type:complete